MNHPYKLTFVINIAAFFVSHRLPIALAARAQGNQVRLITGQGGSEVMEAPAEREIARQGIEHDRVAFSPSSVNPLAESRGLFQLIAAMSRHRPDLVHCASPKGVLYGGLAARMTGVPALVLAISGMGYAFSDSPKPSLSRRAIGAVYRTLVRLAFGHGNKCVIVQNGANRQFLLDQGIARADEIHLIPGSGVDLTDYADVALETKQPVILLPARMLYDKGVVPFVEAARLVHARAPEWRFVLAGAADYDNPASVPRTELEAWNAEGVVEWLGYVGDMVPEFKRASIVCLPSTYGEGMPKALLEAAAASCAVVTTETAGCIDAIDPGQTGDIVSANDAQALADTLLALIDDRARREAYGRAGRALAEQRYSIESVIDQTLEIYARLLARAGKA